MFQSPQVSLGTDFARALDPALLARDCGFQQLDDWQQSLLLSTSRRVLLCCSRQAGKSTITALMALHEALYAPPAMIILISPSQPQSTELFKKIHAFWQRLPGAPEAAQETLTRMQLANGSRIVSLPGSDKTTRGYSGATLVVMDEAARVDDELLAAVRPMLATTDGRFVGLSTPAGKRGWFYEEWQHGEGWERISVTADQCPRITPQFLADEKDALGPLRFEQEYMCIFHDAETSAFQSELIEAALVDDFRPFLPAHAA